MMIAEVKACQQEEPVTVSPFSHIPSYLLPPLYEVKSHQHQHQWENQNDFQISSLSNFSEERPAVEMRREFKSEAILTLVLLVHAAIFLAGIIVIVIFISRHLMRLWLGKLLQIFKAFKQT